MDSTEFRSVLFIAGSTIPGGFEEARSLSVWRALCQTAETWRLDIDAKAPENTPRHTACKSANLVETVSAFLGNTEIQLLVLAGDVALDPQAIPAGLRVAAAVGEGQRVPSVATEIWCPSGDEAIRFAQDGRPVFVIRDTFSPPAEGSTPPAQTTVAIIGEGEEALPDNVHEALKTAEHLVFTSKKMAERLAPEGQSAPVVDTVDDALQLAGTVICLGNVKSGFLGSLLTWAQMNGRTLLYPDTVSSEAELAVDPMRSLLDISGALKQKVTLDAAQVGPLLLRNLGLELTPAMATFHPLARLYHVMYDVNGSVCQGSLGGRIRQRNSQADGLVNAWVRETVPPRGVAARIRATAALSSDTQPEDVLIDVEVWGWTVASYTPPDIFMQQDAGLISMDVSNDQSKATVRYWSRGGTSTIQMGRKPVTDTPVVAHPDTADIYETDGTYPFNRNTLTVIPSNEKLGQKFTRFDLFDNIKKLPSSERLCSMKDQFAGQTAWLVGNGPSVRLDDLDRLSDTGALCFCFNRFHLAHATTRLRPQFTVTADLQMIEDFGQETVDKSGGTVFVADERAPHLIGDYIWIRQQSVSPSLFSRNAAQVVTPGGSSVYVAMQIGYYLGIRRWYMYGADFSFHFSQPRMGGGAFRTAEGEGNHFIQNYRSGRPWCPPAIENILPSFYAARMTMEMEGGFIKNATRGGDLNVFERISFEDAIASTAL